MDELKAKIKRLERTQARCDDAYLKGVLRQEINTLRRELRDGRQEVRDDYREECKADAERTGDE